VSGVSDSFVEARFQEQMLRYSTFIICFLPAVVHGWCIILAFCADSGVVQRGPL